MVDYKWNGRDILFTTFYKNLSLLCKIECSKFFFGQTNVYIKETKSLQTDSKEYQTL